MFHPNTRLLFKNLKVGYGVFATSLIPKGTITYIKDPLEIDISPTKYKELDIKMKEIVNKYSYTEPNGNRIVSWDIGKYVNHCCQSNTISTGYGFEMALRDIQAGEEITDEYGLFNGDEEMTLICDKQPCRGCIRVDDIDKYYPAWDQKIQQVLPSLMEVEQPLWDFLDTYTLLDLQRYMHDPSLYKSVYLLKCKNQNSLNIL